MPSYNQIAFLSAAALVVAAGLTSSSAQADTADFTGACANATIHEVTPECSDALTGTTIALAKRVYDTLPSGFTTDGIRNKLSLSCSTFDIPKESPATRPAQPPTPLDERPPHAAVSFARICKAQFIDAMSLKETTALPVALERDILQFEKDLDTTFPVQKSHQQFPWALPNND